MARSGRLQAKVVRFKKKLTDKGPSLAAGTKRVLTKKLKRFQRAHRTALVLEKRARGAEKGPQPASDKPIGDKPVREKPIGDQPPAEKGEPKEEIVSKKEEA